jgi:hypothetical protein
MSSAGPPDFPPNVPPNIPASYPPNDPPGPQAPLPPAKKSNALVWILGIVVVIVMGSLLTCGIGAFLIMRKAKDAGLDGGLLSKNPAYAVAKMAATLNKDVETVSTDDSTGTIKVRDKRTGETTTLRFDAEKKRMVVIDGNGKQATVSITGDGDKAAINVQSSDGTVNFSAGGNNAMPAWVPVYPGSTPKGTFSSQNKGASQSAFGFSTADPAAKVIEYYRNQLQSSGFTVTQTFATAAGGMITAESGKRTLTVTASASGSETSASLIAVEKE